MDFIDFKQAVESIRNVNQSGTEYWLARDLQSLLGYNEWRNFEQAIERAMRACESTGRDTKYHFVGFNNVITAGKGAELQRKDYFLSRLACYLIAMNGDPKKPEIGLAQVYFAAKTRQQEIQDHLYEQDRRIQKHQQTVNNNRELIRIAGGAGVTDFDIFDDKGYRGLYDMPLKEIKKTKGVDENRDLLDFIGLEELAAHDFRITQTARRLLEAGIDKGNIANEVHFAIARTIRKAIQENGNPFPESLLPEPDIRALEVKNNKQKPPKS